MRSRRSVTLQPIGMPSRSLKPAIDFLARVITGFWPAISAISPTAASTFLRSCEAFADAHVEDDLGQPRHLHRVRVLELLHAASCAQWCCSGRATGT